MTAQVSCSANIGGPGSWLLIGEVDEAGVVSSCWLDREEGTIGTCTARAPDDSGVIVWERTVGATDTLPEPYVFEVGARPLWDEWGTELAVGE